MIFTPRIQKAMEKAALLHDEQYRKDKKLPYIVHPIAVMLILTEYTKDEDLLVAALLHDVLEDVPGYFEADMRAEFGERVVSIVKGVTEPKDPNTTENKLPWHECKRQYMENLTSAPEESVMLAAADKIHNLISLIHTYNEYGDETWELFNSTAEDRLWYFESVVQIIIERLGDKNGLSVEVQRQLGEFRDLIT